MMGETLVQQVQGYLFSRPLPARDVAELIGRLNGASRNPRKMQSMVNER
jgi:EAL domain-containing protein (putative c-di-GMP-specific phosphodiesterase class I)